MAEMNKTLDEIRAELDEQYRAQIEDEIRKRKEIEEKYYTLCDELEDTADKLEKAHLRVKELARANRELIGAKKSFINHILARKNFAKREHDLLNKGMEFWGCVFDAAYYAENNPDVVKEIGIDEQALLEHFVTLGIYQERQGSKAFDVEKYLLYNEDVANSCKKDKRDAYIHYIMYGKDEKRRK